jgi:hypothetical protein
MSQKSKKVVSSIGYVMIGIHGLRKSVPHAVRLLLISIHLESWSLVACRISPRILQKYE